MFSNSRSRLVMAALVVAGVTAGLAGGVDQEFVTAAWQH
jgi:hypothetical protein